MRDIIADWKRWTRAEKLFAGVLTLFFSAGYAVLPRLF